MHSSLIRPRAGTLASTLTGTLVRALPILVVLGLPQLGHAQAPAAPPPAAGAVVLSTDPGASSIGYHMVHKLHKFDALSKKVEGKVKILPGGAAQIAMRAPVESFDSGNVNRDAHMKEVTEAAKFPHVEFKGICGDCATPASFPSTVDKTIKGEVSFHGIKKALDVPVKLTYESAGRIHAVAKLSLSLDEFKIERPSLLFAKVDDELKLDIDIVVKQ